MTPPVRRGSTRLALWRGRTVENVPPLSTPAQGQLLRRETALATYLEPTILQGHSRLRCGFTTRHAGRSGHTLNLSFDKGGRTEVLTNRQRLLQAMGLEHTPLYTVRQVHGSAVCVIDATAQEHGLSGVAADALITNLPGIALGVLVADCLPIVLYTRDTPVIGLVHAGRMGTYHRVVQQTLTALAQHCATSPTDLYAILGPSIGPCCYTLDIHAVSPFQKHFPTWERFFLPRTHDRWTMDLIAANTLQLRAAGVPSSHIASASLCTVCHHHDLYSHRAEGQEAGRGMAIIACLARSP